ncbi:MAG: hypothetical protein H8K03_14340 [Nitrospira sp.]|jgi:hypothetical protein|nr:hypothetical protein [Nitrospira sp. BO4]
MKCTRCCGLMIVDHLLDMQESYLPMWMRAHRCVTCGNIVDPVIQHNRMVRRAQRAERLASRLARTAAQPAQAA